MSANDVEAGCDAQITEEGVCFFQYEQFLPLVKRYPGVKSLIIEVTPEGIQIGNTNISRGFWEVSLFGDPVTAPLRLVGGVKRPPKAKQRLDKKSEVKAETEAVNFVVVAIDASERRLAKQIEDEEVDENAVTYSTKIKRCDLCEGPANEMCLFVDGKLRGEAIWANMCAACFFEKGEGIGWGVGQLYARQADGRWRLVRGFPPNNPTRDASPL